MALATLAPSVIDLAERVEPLIVGISFPTVSVAEASLSCNWLIHVLFGIYSGGSPNAMISVNFNLPVLSNAYKTVAFFPLTFLEMSTA